MYFSTVCKKKKGGKCRIKWVGFWNRFFFLNNKPSSQTTNQNRASQEGIFNYSLLLTSQSGKVDQLWGVHQSVVISIGYPVDKSGHIQKLHTTAQALLQSI